MLQIPDIYIQISSRNTIIRKIMCIWGLLTIHCQFLEESPKKGRRISKTLLKGSLKACKTNLSIPWGTIILFMEVLFYCHYVFKFYLAKYLVGLMLMWTKWIYYCERQHNKNKTEDGTKRQKLTQESWDWDLVLLNHFLMQDVPFLDLSLLPWWMLTSQSFQTGPSPSLVECW